MLFSVRLAITPHFSVFKAHGGTLRRLGDRHSVEIVTIQWKELPVLCCAGDADFATLCRNLPSYLVELLYNQRLVGNS